MRAKYRLIPVLLLTASLLSSCALLPEEEIPKTAPLIRTYEREQFETAFVQREDLILTQKISCTYVPVQRETLPFALGGEYVDEVFVQLGDSVKKGDLLAQLRLNNIEERIAQTKVDIKEYELRLSNIDAVYELDVRRSEIKHERSTDEEKREALEALEKSYNTSRGSVEDALELKRVTLAVLEKQLAERQIIAPFDGTITYAAKFKNGEMSAFGHTVVTIADSTLSLFRAETDKWSSFKKGDEFDIAVSKNLYAAVVADEAELGIAETEKIEGEKAYVYFRLKEPTFDLESGDRGTIDLVLDERYDVLTVPKESVSTAGEQSIVYYQREDGMKAYKPIVTGITVGKRTEVISGLEEGDLVIVK